MILWNDLNKMLSLYLYGTEVPPENYEERLRERPISKVSVEVDSLDYMVNGAGRYAYASQAKVVQDFFNTVNIPDGSYTKEQLIALFGYSTNNPNFDNWHFAVTQSEVDSTSNDYALRALMYNSTRFFISDNALFVVKDGVRYIENMSIIPEKDNFDFESGTSIGGIGNFAYVQHKIDPHNIGETVHINYVGLGVKKDGSYTYQDYLADQQKVITQSSMDLLKLIDEIPDILNNPALRNVLDYTTSDGGEIEYGTSYGDLLQTSDKGDIVVAGSGGDIVQSYAGNDIIYGGKGNDTLEGGTGFDTYRFNGTYGFDTISDSDHLGKIVINGIDLSGTAKTESSTNSNSVTPIYKLASNGKTYDLTLLGGDLFIREENDLSNGIVIKGFKNGSFGITLDEDTNSDKISDWINSALQSFANAVLSAVRPKDPLIIDTNNNGLKLSSWQSLGVKFDMDANGTSESTGWTTPSNSNYQYNKGTGAIIIDAANANLTDRIVFGSGISKDDLTFSQVGVFDSSVSGANYHSDLVITFKNSSNDKITILNYFRSSIYEWNNGVGTYVEPEAYKINGLKFADGSEFNFSDLHYKAEGAEGSDNLSGGSGVNPSITFINAKAGNDSIYGNNILANGL